MNIAVTSQGDNLDSPVDPRFGRCNYFLIIDSDTLEFEAVENSSSQARGGAGIQSGQLMSSKGVKAVLTGNVGPNAFQTLNEAGIEIFLGASGTVREAVESYKEGKLDSTEGPSVDSHSNMPGG
ncbi:MAG: NifB/NifX family molybdenum-iron cluster-binding protein [Spirochaetes bacterium]|nr:NifB/NifX family molybdenum-iron cluster-binding protein [Spirochaetota bacterium]